MKVCFLFNQWNYYNMFILWFSIFGFYMWLLIVDGSFALFPEYYYSARMTLSERVTWLFSTFTIPICFGLLDLFGQAMYLFFHTGDDLIYREKSLESEIIKLRSWYTCGSKSNSPCRTRSNIEAAHSI